MAHFVGLDVSVKETSVCVGDANQVTKRKISYLGSTDPRSLYRCNVYFLYRKECPCRSVRVLARSPANASRPLFGSSRGLRQSGRVSGDWPVGLCDGRCDPDRCCCHRGVRLLSRAVLWPRRTWPGGLILPVLVVPGFFLIVFR